MYCTYCGKEIPDDSLFCEFCGNRVDEEPVEENTQEEVKPTSQQGIGNGTTKQTYQYQSSESTQDTYGYQGGSNGQEYPSSSAHGSYQSSPSYSQPSVNHGNSKSFSGTKKILVGVVVLLLVAVGLYLGIKKPWQSKGDEVATEQQMTTDKNKPEEETTSLEDQEATKNQSASEEIVSAEDKMAAIEGTREAGDTKRERVSVGDDSGEWVGETYIEANPRDDKEADNEEVFQPMTPVEIAKQSSFIVGDAQAMHIDWIDDESIKLVYATYDPGQFDDRPPEWGSDRWQIYRSEMVSYFEEEDAIELFVIDEGGLRYITRLEFYVEDNDIAFIMKSDYDELGSVADQYRVAYWPD